MSLGFIRRARRTCVLAACATTALLATGAITAAADTSARSTGAPTSPAPARAPKDFQTRVIEAYAEIHAAAVGHPAPGAAPPPTVETFARLIRSMTPAETDELYRGGPGVWQQARDAARHMPDLKDLAFAPPPMTPTTAAPAATEPVHAAALPRRAADAQPAPPPLPEVLSAPVLPEAVPQIPCPPTTTVAALLTAKLGFEEAVKAIEIKEAGTINIVFQEVGGEGVDEPNPMGVALHITEGVLEALVDGTEYAFENLENCYIGMFVTEDLAVNDDARVIGEDNQVLTDGENKILAAESTITGNLDSGYGQVGKDQTNLQSSVNTAQAALDEQLKLRIETALAGGEPEAAFQLPASAGGYLDATPIGVQRIVTDALHAMLAAHQPIDSAGPRELALADKALAAKHYKQAYFHYQHAYQAIAN